MSSSAAIAALQFGDDLASLTTVEGALDRFMAEANRFGFYHINSGEIPPLASDLPMHLHCGTMPEEFSRRYVEHTYVEIDPVAIYTAKSSRPISWKALTNPRLFKKRSVEIMCEPREWSIMDGIVLPQHETDGTIGVISVSGDEFDISESERSSLLFMMGSLYTRLQEIAGSKRSMTPTVPALSPRERECLYWAALGKSDWDIGEILTIAESTAHDHIERAKRKYQVRTRVQAVVLAIKCGEIAP